MDILTNIKIGFIAVATVVSSLLGFAGTANSPLVGASYQTPEVRALFETTLASAITGSATSMTLTSAVDKDGNSLSSSTYAFIIDEGTSAEEFVLADCTATACTNMSRGISVSTGTSTVAALQFVHRRGASVKMTDAPALVFAINVFKGKQNIENVLTYNSAVSIATTSNQIPRASWVNNLANLYIANATSSLLGLNNTWTGTDTFSNTVTTNGALNINGAATFASTIAAGGAKITGLGTPTLNTDAATKAYVDGVAVAGVAVSNNTTVGIGYTASTTQIAGGLSGGTTTPYFIPSTLASSTASTTGQIVVVTNSNKKIDPSFLNGASDNYTFAGSVSMTGVTTLATTTVSQPSAIIDSLGQPFIWSFLASTSLSANNTSLTLSSIPPRKWLKVFITMPGTASGADTVKIRFNGDIQANYTYQTSTSTLSNGVGDTGIILSNTSSGAILSSLDIRNFSTTTHPMIINTSTFPAYYATTSVGVTGTKSAVWATSTAQQITSIGLSVAGNPMMAETSIYVFGSQF